MLDCLKIYTNMGWALFPCSVRTKKPITPHGFKDASLDWRQIVAWHEQYPGCALGTPTSAERAALDTDPRNGGDVSLARLEAEHGALPWTPKVRTGGGGFHHWLRFPPGTTCRKVADGVDLKADGGYVIVPPSKIAIAEHQGRAYYWTVRPWETGGVAKPRPGSWRTPSSPRRRPTPLRRTTRFAAGVDGSSIGWGKSVSSFDARLLCRNPLAVSGV